MSKYAWFLLIVFMVLFAGGSLQAADSITVLGVEFPKEKVVADKTLTLNGVAFRKAFGFINVYAVGLYLETPTDNARTVISSDQVKQLYFHYLTSKATASKLQKGFLDLMRECNPPDVYQRNAKDVALYASWLDKDMKQGLTSISTYVPGKGLTLEYQGEVRGTIKTPEFIEMYYTYNFGDKAKAKIRDGLLGKKK